MTWEMVPLKDIGTWYGGGTPSKRKQEYWVDGTVPWLSPKDMGGDVLSRTKDRITEAAVSDSSVRLVPANSVAMVVRSGILEHTFPVATVPFETTLNQDMKAVVVDPGVDSQWLAWGLKAFERTILRTCRKAGTTVASIDTKRLQNFCLPVPPVDEQRHLVTLIEEILTGLGSAGQSLAFSRKRIAIGQEEILRRTFSSTHGRLVTLGDIATWGSGGTPKSKTPAYYENGTIPWINSGDLRHGPIFDASKKITQQGLIESSAKWVPVESVLVAMYGATIGRTGITRIPVTTNQAVAFAIPDTSVVTPEFLFWFLRSQARGLAAAGQGGAQPNISQTVLKSWPARLPNLARQRELVEKSATLCARFGELDNQLLTTQHRSDVLRRAILIAIFECRLTGPTATNISRKELEYV